MKWVEKLLGRWRAGKDTLAEAEPDGHETPNAPDNAFDGGRICVKTSGNEQAERLVELMRAHGLASEIRRPGGKEVEVACPDEADRRVIVDATRRAVELWLFEEDTPSTVDVRFGSQKVTVGQLDPGSHSLE